MRELIALLVIAGVLILSAFTGELLAHWTLGEALIVNLYASCPPDDTAPMKSAAR